MDSNPPMNKNHAADIQDDSSINSDPAGFNNPSKKSKTVGKSYTKKGFMDNNPSDPSAKRSKTVGFQKSSMMPTSMITDIGEEED